MNRAQLPEMVAASVIAVLRAADAGDYLPACRTLTQAGILALELTLTTPGTIDELARQRHELPQACFGVGTVVDAESASAAIAAGAAFIVTPNVNLDVIAAVVQAGVPVVVGALTPTEVHMAWTAGASAVKIFPASAVGPGYLKQLRGPFPDLVAIPSGGVEIEHIREWMRSGATAVSLGGPLLGDALKGGDPQRLAYRARSALSAVRSM